MDNEELTIREKLIAGSLVLIDDEGTDGLTVRRLAAAGDRSSMCVYSKFGSRSGLLEASFTRAADEFLQAIASDPESAIPAWAAAHPRRYSFLFDVPVAGLGIDPKLRSKLLDRTLEALGDSPDPLNTWARIHGTVAASRIRHLHAV